jgi:hypothetical protein
LITFRTTSDLIRELQTKHSYKRTIAEEKLQRYENYSKFQTQEHGSIITGKRQEAIPECTGQEECTNYQQNGRTNHSIWEDKQTPNEIFRKPRREFREGTNRSGIHPW